ncbi:MAG: molybdopterin-dependent oxidoreductase [Tepidisphaeraceae bacterium]
MSEPNDTTSGGSVPRPATDAVDLEMRRRTRRSFFGAAVAAAAGYGGWNWLRSRRQDDGLPWPLRRVLEVNEQIARDYANPSHRAEEHAFGAAPENPRINGDLGLDSNLDMATWRLHVSGIAAPMANDGGAVALTLDDIRALPRVDVAMRLCCIEGWSILVNWSGARFRDFVMKYPPITRSGNPPDFNRPGDLFDYVSMETPDGSYYVGLDMASAIHPQTLLCYEIDGRPLTPEHGAPLRLVIPNKYGVKNIKQIGRIRYTGVRPADYWAQQGYDWYAGL